MEPLIIENALPDNIFKPLQSLLLDTPDKVPFFFQKHTTYANDENPIEDDLCDYQWSHSIFHEADGGAVSSLWEPIKELFEYIFKEYGFPEAQVHRVKLNALNAHYTPITHAPHIDTTSSKKHFTMVLYINDSSGDTVLYEEVGPLDQGQKPTEVLRVRPEANKLLVFNSSQNHSSSTPEDVKVRYIVNAVFRVG